MIKITSIVFRIACIVAAVELSIMIVLPDLPELIGALLDAGSLTLISSPLIYYFVIRPYVQARDDAEKAVLSAQQRAEEANEAKSRFIGTMSQSVRAPLSGIISQAGFLVGSLSQSDHRSIALTVRLASEDLLATFNNIIDYVDIETQSKSLTPSKFELLSTINGAAEVIRLRLQKIQTTPRLQLETTLPIYAYGYPTVLTQVLINLATALHTAPRSKDMLISLAAEQSPTHAIRAVIAADLPDQTTAEPWNSQNLNTIVAKRLLDAVGGSLSFTRSAAGRAQWSCLIPITRLADDDILSRHLAGARVLIAATEVEAKLWSRWLADRGCFISLAHIQLDAAIRMSEAASDKRPYDLVIMGDLANKEESLLSVLPLMPEHGFCKFIAFGANAADHTSDATLLYANAPSSRDQFEADLLKHISEEAVCTPDRFTLPAAKRLLVIDRDPTIQLLVAAMLRGCNIRVDTASTVEEAVSLITPLSYNLALLELPSPGADGSAVGASLSLLKSRLESAVTIGLVDSSAHDSVPALITAGLNDFVYKPIHRAKLLQTILRWTGAHDALPPPLPEAPEALPNIDHDHLRQFIEDFGEEDVKPLMHSFLKETIVRLDVLAAAATSTDLHTLERESHTLKGNAGNLGFYALSETAGALCLACREANWDKVKANADQLPHLFEALLETLEHHYPEFAKTS